MSEHVCVRCGEKLNPVNWWTASVQDRYGEGSSFKLCRRCAIDVENEMQMAIAIEEHEKNLESLVLDMWDEVRGSGSCMIPDYVNRMQHLGIEVGNEQVGIA